MAVQHSESKGDFLHASFNITLRWKEYGNRVRIREAGQIKNLISLAQVPLGYLSRALVAEQTRL
jgi:hypothetical protein